jgi:hypothetical protein
MANAKMIFKLGLVICSVGSVDSVNLEHGGPRDGHVPKAEKRLCTIPTSEDCSKLDFLPAQRLHDGVDDVGGIELFLGVAQMRNDGGL